MSELKLSKKKERHNVLQVVLVINIFTGALKALQPSTAADLKSAKYGKVPRSVAIANNVS